MDAIGNRTALAAVAATVVAVLAVPATAPASITTGGVTAPVAGSTSGATAVTAPSISTSPTATGGAQPGTVATTAPTAGTRAPRRPHRRRRRRRRTPTVSQQVVVLSHHFPLAGAFTYGDGFGATRPGHTHQGQDLLAAQGTPVVAPRDGTVTQVAYQAGGAGYYVVMSGAGENLDYAFMHLVAGSTRVRVGQTVRSGQRIGDVGSTGASSAPHLHFEIWQGVWQQGGRAVDPLPYLKRWRAAT